MLDSVVARKLWIVSKVTDGVVPFALAILYLTVKVANVFRTSSFQEIVDVLCNVYDIKFVFKLNTGEMSSIRLASLDVCPSGGVEVEYGARTV